MARHAIFLDPLHTPAPGDRLTLEGDEAKHAARVKRLVPGDIATLFNGRGLVAEAAVVDAKRSLTVDILSTHTVEPIRPRIEVCSATPKGPRLDKMLDQLSQAGAAAWAPMSTKLGVVDPRDTKLARMERITIESAKQCTRPWALEIGERCSFDDAMTPDGDTTLVVADARGAAYEPTGGATVRIFVGPEGGLVPEELDAATNAGARLVALSPHILRIETAAVLATGAVLNAEHAGGYHPNPDHPRAETS
ncbi:MAG: RsmE family RNA methyltransferase [Planctomycetota bacterium]